MRWRPESKNREQIHRSKVLGRLRENDNFFSLILHRILNTPCGKAHSPLYAVHGWWRRLIKIMTYERCCRIINETTTPCDGGRWRRVSGRSCLDVLAANPCSKNRTAAANPSRRFKTRDPNVGRRLSAKRTDRGKRTHFTVTVVDVTRGLNKRSVADDKR